MAWDDTQTDGVSQITSAKWNAMVTDQKTRGVTTEQKRGSNCSGSDGDTGRVLTLSNSSTTKSDGFMCFVGGNFLHSADLTVNHKSANSTITFTNPVWDSDYIEVIYFT